VDSQVQLGESVIALVGKNGVGKTTVLHAIQLACELCLGSTEFGFQLSPRDPSQPCEFVLDFSVNGKDCSYYYSRVVAPTASESIHYCEKLSLGGEILFDRHGEALEVPDGAPLASVRLGVRASALSVLLQILPEDHALRSRLQPVASFLGSVRYYPLLQGFQEHSYEGSSFIEKSKYDVLFSELKQGRRTKSVQIRLIYMWLSARDKFDELKALLGRDGLGLLDDIQVEEVEAKGSANSLASTETTYAISFMPGAGLAGASRWFRFSGLSAGTWRILQLLTCLVFDDTSCMLLEQPEDCVHSGLLIKVIDILQTYSERTQLICTTHSASVMNLVGAKGIRFVTSARGETVVTKFDDDGLASASAYLQSEGTLAEFLETL